VIKDPGEFLTNVVPACFFVLLLSGSAQFVAASPPSKYEYVGSKPCAECHMSKQKGNQYVHWLSSRHAFAYWRLATDWAKFLASRREDYKHIQEPIKEERCLKCHYAGAQDAESRYASTFNKEEGVGCEACHGPGSAYMEPSVMQDRKQFLEHGGVIPDETICKKCHRDEQFEYEVWVKKIAHPRPDKASEP